MNKIHLKGRLGQEFGEVWELDVKTPKEAMLAINANTDGRFLRYLNETSREKNIGYSFQIGGITVDENNTVLITGPCGKDEIVITPVIGGAYGVVTNIIIQLVVAVVLTVVSSMLAPSPQIDTGSNEDSARKDSYLFSGGPQPAKQGKPVPVGYGKMIVYPIPISVEFEYNSPGRGVPPWGYTSSAHIGYNRWDGYYGADPSTQSDIQEGIRYFST